MPAKRKASASKDRIYDPACGSGGSLPASRLCALNHSKKKPQGHSTVSGQGRDPRVNAGMIEEFHSTNGAPHASPFGASEGGAK